MRAELLTWQGGEHDFALTVPLLLALQSRCDGDGVGLIYQRIVQGVPRVNDIVATIALALEGGGMGKQDARELTLQQVEDNGLNALSLLSQIVLAAALNGWPEAEDQEQGEAPGEAPQNP